MTLVVQEPTTVVDRILRRDRATLHNADASYLYTHCSKRMDGFTVFTGNLTANRHRFCAKCVRIWEREHTSP